MKVVKSSSSRPAVLMLTNMWPHEGNPAYGVFVCRQVQSLEARGLNCDAIFVEGYRSRWNYVRESLRMLKLNFSPHRPQLVHAHGGETALVARFFVRGPVIVSYCGDDLLGTPRASGSIRHSSRIRRFVLRHHARLTTATITKSAEMERALPPSVQLRNRVVPNGVDRSAFHPRPRAKARAVRGWSDHERVVLFAADPAVERKRFWLAQAACREAEQTVGPIKLEVAWGTPPEDMPILMASSDCLLLTSAIEGSPNVVKEAMACGLPVISTAVGDVRELLAGVEPSWICEPEPAVLAAAVVDCLRDRRRSDGWSRSAWLDQDAIADRLLAVYEQRGIIGLPSKARG